MTLPSTPRREATILKAKGIKINGIYYWSDEFNTPGMAGKNVLVRYDPLDVSRAYVYVNKAWIRCDSQSNLFVGLTLRQIQAASAVVRRVHQLAGRDDRESTPQKAAQFIRRLENVETFLKEELETLRKEKAKGPSKDDIQQLKEAVLSVTDAMAQDSQVRRVLAILDGASADAVAADAPQSAETTQEPTTKQASAASASGSTHTLRASKKATGAARARKSRKASGAVRARKRTPRKVGMSDDPLLARLADDEGTAATTDNVPPDKTYEVGE